MLVWVPQWVWELRWALIAREWAPPRVGRQATRNAPVVQTRTQGSESCGGSCSAHSTGPLPVARWCSCE